MGRKTGAESVGPFAFSRGSSPASARRPLTIAGLVENEHQAVIKLVRCYLPDFQEFGFLGFEIRENRGTQGAPTEYAILSEDQAYLLLTY